MDKLNMFNKKKKKKNIFKIVTLIIIPLLGTIISVIFSGDEDKIVNNGDGAVIVNDSKNNEIRYENNINPTLIEEENGKYNQILSNKIHSFFENLNGDKEYQARNNIFKDLSRKFTPELIHEFCINNKSIVIRNIPKEGKINNDKKVVSNSFDVEILYDYLGKTHLDKVNINVRLNPNDSEEKDIHINRVTCFDNQIGPFCDMFGR